MNLYRLKDNPQYTYAYQVAAEDEQTYIAHQEQRDGTDVSIYIIFLHDVEKLELNLLFSFTFM